MSPKRKIRYVGVLLIVMHVAGFIGMQFQDTRVWFEQLTPLNLLISAMFLIYFQHKPTRTFLFVSVLIAIMGFGIEVLGVHTGVIFGKYAYGKNLGIKLWDVPILIGINWWILIYCFGVWIDRYSQNMAIKSILTATALVSLDVLIEPVAIQHDLWHWFGQKPPTQNYVAWFIFALGLAIIFHTTKFKKINPLVNYLIVAQILFFGLHQVLLL